MRALLLSEYQNLNVVEVEKPRLGSKDVLVSVKACGICGSDVHGYDGSSGRRIPPLVMGHEAAGLVTRLVNGKPVSLALCLPVTARTSEANT